MQAFFFLQSFKQHPKRKKTRRNWNQDENKNKTSWWLNTSKNADCIFSMEWINNQNSMELRVALCLTADRSAYMNVVVCLCVSHFQFGLFCSDLKWSKYIFMMLVFNRLLDVVWSLFFFIFLSVAYSFVIGDMCND